MKYINIIRDWLEKKRHFGQELLLSSGILLVLLLLLKGLGRLIFKVTTISIGGIVLVMLIYVLIVFIIRIIEIRRKR